MFNRVPWSSVAALLDVAAGLAVWAWFTQKARDKTEEWLDLMGIKDESVLKDQITAGYVATLVVVTIVSVLIIACAFWRTCKLERKAERTGNLQGTQCFLTCSGIMGFLCWLLVIWLVVVIACYAAWLTGAYIVQELSKHTVKLFNDQNQQGGLLNLRSLSDDLTAQYHTYASTLSGQSLSTFKNRFESLINRISDVAGNNKSCPNYCLDIDRLSFVDDGPCICDATVIQRSQVLARDVLQNDLYAVVGLFVLLIGELMLLLNLTAMFHETTSLQYAVARIEHKYQAQTQQQHVRTFVPGDQEQPLATSRQQNQFYQA